ncbi:serine acetyltransferase [Bradyrhizobium diazoefficiens]|nr:serine acetyltransferase [Bradyrhizobium diazoefficiens]MBR0851319.1 serine acetyltransferase [Bradyrhizobium diazoefficiens]
MTVPHESVLRKIAADFNHYAERESAYYANASRFSTRLLIGAKMALLIPGFQFVMARRVQELLARIPVVGSTLRRIAWWFSCIVFGSELGIASEIAGGLYVPHPYGIVVGRCRIGRNVTILQNVTIGFKSRNELGACEIGDGAYLAAGCVVLGAIKVGEGATIGANAVVTSDVPPNAVAVGIPARVVKSESAADAGAAAPARAAL